MSSGSTAGSRRPPRRGSFRWRTCFACGRACGSTTGARAFPQPMRDRRTFGNVVRNRRGLEDVAWLNARRAAARRARPRVSGTKVLRPPSGRKARLARPTHVSLVIDRRLACRAASAAPSGPSRARPRASIARAPAGRSPAPAAPHRRRHPRARCGRSSRRLRCRCSERPSGFSEHVRELLAQRCVAWEADQLVSLPSSNSATAHDGPIEPWVWMANS